MLICHRKYDSKEKYEQLINKLNTKKDRVLLYPNYIPNNKVVNFFCAADIVVQPYLSATQSGVSMIAYNFNKLTDLSITFWDERLSTVAAERILLEADTSRRRRREVIDHVAAGYILQGALERIKNFKARQ